MFLKKAGSQSQWNKQQWAISALAMLVVLLLIPLPGNTEGTKSNRNRLPPAPNNGTPEEEFVAGGTRNNPSGDTACSVID